MPKMLGALIDYLTYATAEGEELSPFIARLVGIFGENTAFVVAMTAGMVLTALLMMIGGVGGAYFGAKAAVNYAADLRSDIFKKVQEFSFSNIDRFSTGSLVTRLTNDVTQIQNFVNMLLRMALRAPGMFIGALIMAFATNRELSVVFLVSLPLLIIALYAIIRRGFPRFSAMQSKIDTLNSDIQENITNVRVVKSFVRQEHEKHYIHNLCDTDTHVAHDGVLPLCHALPCDGIRKAYFRGVGRKGRYHRPGARCPREDPCHKGQRGIPQRFLPLLQGQRRKGSG